MLWWSLLRYVIMHIPDVLLSLVYVDENHIIDSKYWITNIYYLTVFIVAVNVWEFYTVLVLFILFLFLRFFMCFYFLNLWFLNPTFCFSFVVLLIFTISNGFCFYQFSVFLSFFWFYLFLSFQKNIYIYSWITI